jgi:cell wall-associated NlpC family hydrolase
VARTGPESSRPSAERGSQSSESSELTPFSPDSEGTESEGVWPTVKDVADSYLGVGYRYGGRTRAGMDCSGFVGQVFEEALGMALPRRSRAQIGEGTSVARSDLRPGDLVFFRNWLVVDHVGIYYGEDRFIHSSSTLGVTVTPLDDPYFRTRYAGARRLFE